MKRTCVQCGKEFEITDSEAAFYKSKNLQLPKRCKECRTENKGKTGSKKTDTQKDNKPVSHSPAQNTAKKGGKSKKSLYTAAAFVLFLIIVLCVSFFGKGNQNDTPQPDYDRQDEITQQLPFEQDDDQNYNDAETDSPFYAEDSGSGSYGDSQTSSKTYRFRNQNLLDQHYNKHGREMGFKSAAAYEAAASDVINNPNALHKTEKEDGDHVYYIKSTNEFVVLSTDGYIRTYYQPSGGLDYFNKQ